MNPDIINFIKKQTCATIACVDENNKPYCFNCFFAFNADLGLLYFKSQQGAYHSSIIKKNPVAAGTILPDKLKTLLVQGIQFEGEFLGTTTELEKQASEHYYKKHPLALAMPGEMWVIQINHIKMTDSMKGFGYKTAWSRDEQLAVG